MTFEPGQKIGDYEIVARLGADDNGAVYDVQHLTTRRREAMKILPLEQGTPEMVQPLTTLNHVNIARVHNAFSYENHLVIIMELIHGETVRNLRARMGITMRQALDYTEQTLKALGYAHRLGVVHGDIKPSNIMITSGGFVKLLDFSIALTSAGSLSYKSPEQISGSKATARSDIYSVGVTLYELLAGTLPVKENNPAPVRLNQLAPEVPGVVSDAVMRALARDPTAPTDTSWPAAPAAGTAPPIVSVDEISRKLAAYIGPVAKFVVKKLAAQSEDLDFIYREAAKEIPSEADRAAFLRSRRQ